MLRKRSGFFVLMLSIGFTWLFPASGPGTVSIEKMFGRKLLVKLSTPQYVWLPNGKA